MMLPHALETLARPEHAALIGAGSTIPYRELRTLVSRRAGGLLELGVRAGKRVLLPAHRTLDTLVDLHALMWLGAVPALIAPALTAEERDLALSALAPDRPTSPPRLGALTPSRPRALDDEALCLLTSGTSGAPERVDLSVGQLAFSASASALRLGHHLDDRWLDCLPLHHIGGVSIALRCALYGTTVELVNRFDAEAVARRLHSGEVTQVSLVPEMLRRVLDARPEQPFPAALRVILVGGAACPPGLTRRCEALGAPLSRTWGMSQTASQVCTTVPGDFAPGLPPLPFAQVRSERGALTVRGPIAGGSLRSSDAGQITDGRVHVRRRRDTVIVSGGLKIDPSEVESVLLQHEDVREAAVLGLPDPRWGHRPVALLVSQARRPSAAELDAWCRQRLQAYKVPEAFGWTQALPRNAMGKRPRRALLDELQAAQGIEEVWRRRAACDRALRPLRKADEGVFGAHDGVLDLTDEGNPKADRALAEPLHLQVSGDAVPLTDGHREVGLGVHQGHAEAPLEDGLGVAEAGRQQLLEADVRVLEEAPEEDDPGAIDLVEASGQRVGEGHQSTDGVGR